MLGFIEFYLHTFVLGADSGCEINCFVAYCGFGVWDDTLVHAPLLLCIVIGSQERIYYIVVVSK
jgi:hypothetical protein